MGAGGHLKFGLVGVPLSSDIGPSLGWQSAGAPKRHFVTWYDDDDDEELPRSCESEGPRGKTL